MKKKFICTVCGYIYEGTEAPESCPVCHAPKSKFKEMDEVGDQPAFATVHTLGAARKEEANAEMIKDLETHFNGECGEVGMYLAMSRQAALPRTLRLPAWTPHTIPFMRWLKTRLAIVLASWVSTRDTLLSKKTLDLYQGI